MQDFKAFDISDLLDILAQKTSHYMKMLSGGATKDAFDSCRETIVDIQSEIKSRKMRKNKAPDSNLSHS